MSLQNQKPVRYLIAGGAGFIGLAFTKFLISKYPDSEITILDKLTYASRVDELNDILEKSKIRFIKGDITDFETVSYAMKNTDIVVNFAAESHVDRSITDSIPFVYSNVLGVQVLLECALKDKIKCFIQISTDEVYGSIESGSWTEESPIDPNSPYAASKAAGDLLALAFWKTHGIDIRITRCSNNYGPGQFPEKLIPKSIKQIFDSIPIQIYGNGKNLREWIHVDDHCKAIMMVIENGAAGEIYNIGSSVMKSNNEIAETLINLAHPEFQASYRFIEDRKGHDLRYSVDFSKIGKLGFKPEITFTVGIKETYKWYRSKFIS